MFGRFIGFARRFRARTTLLLAAMAVSAAVLGTTGYATMQARAEENLTTREWAEISDTVNAMSEQGQIAFTGMWQAFTAPGTVDMTAVAAAADAADRYMIRLGEITSRDPIRAEMFRQANEARDRYRVFERQAFELLAAGDIEGAMAFTQQADFAEVSAAVGQPFVDLMQGLEQRSREAQEQSQVQEDRILKIFAGGLALIGLLWAAIIVDWVRQTYALEQAHSRLEGMNDELERRVVSRTSELNEARERAESANRAKTEFLAAMSHELRTPLNGVLGMATVLGRSPLSESQKSMLDVIETSGRSLLTLLNDVLDFARLDAGRLELRHEPFALDELLERIVAVHTADAQKKGLGLSLCVAPEARHVYMGDEVRLRQLLGHLVSNAVKFTDAGEVALDASMHAGRVRISVRDTGPGIGEDVRSHLFERFSQGDNSARRRHGGVGLGLALARELTAAMGGDIGVDSVVGAGSEFWVELPLDRWVQASQLQAHKAA